MVYAMAILTCILLMPDNHVHVAVQDGGRGNCFHCSRWTPDASYLQCHSPWLASTWPRRRYYSSSKQSSRGFNPLSCSLFFFFLLPSFFSSSSSQRVESHKLYLFRLGAHVSVLRYGSTLRKVPLCWTECSQALKRMEEKGRKERELGCCPRGRRCDLWDGLCYIPTVLLFFVIILLFVLFIAVKTKSSPQSEQLSLLDKHPAVLSRR